MKLIACWAARGPAEVSQLIRDHPIRYYPFPGEIVGHPSVLSGTIEDIADSARRLTDLENVHGLDLLAYRHKGDVLSLMHAVCSATDKPVIMAGSIDSRDRIEAVAAAGAAGFTVGTAAFDGTFPAEKEGLVDQVRAILEMTGTARRLSRAPRKIALVAHNGRKSHLKAWVARHAKVLRAQRLVCTGGTGAMLLEADPGLTVQRLQRGSHGGDQQLGALIASGELDAIIFFANPHGSHGTDVDLMALTRLAVFHDTPILCSPSAADLFVSAGLGQ